MQSKDAGHSVRKPIAARFPAEWKAIQSLAHIGGNHHNKQLSKHLDRIIEAHIGRLGIVQDVERSGRIRAVLSFVQDAIDAINVIRAVIGQLDAVTVRNLLIQMSALKAVKPPRKQMTWSDLDTLLRRTRHDVALTGRALSHATGVLRTIPANRPKHPYSAPTIELIALWERLTGKKAPSPKSIKGANATPSAEFVHQGLRMLDSTISRKATRTSFTNALTAMKNKDKFLTILKSGGTRLDVLSAGFADLRKQKRAKLAGRSGATVNTRFAKKSVKKVSPKSLG